MVAATFQPGQGRVLAALACLAKDLTARAPVVARLAAVLAVAAVEHRRSEALAGSSMSSAATAATVRLLLLRELLKLMPEAAEAAALAQPGAPEALVAVARAEERATRPGHRALPTRAAAVVAHGSLPQVPVVPAS